MTGSGYGDLDLDAAATLEDRAEVDRYSLLGFINEVSINGEPVMSVIGFERQSTIDLTVIDGRLPVAADEVALGRTTADDLGVGVDDEVTLSGAIDDHVVATVTGLVVFPALGPFDADRVATGTGMLLSEALAEGDASGLATFVGVDLVDGDDAARARGELLAEMRGWDVLGQPAITFADPVRPPEIVDAGSMRTVPALLVALGMAAIAIGLAFALWASARSRRREIGVLRALGLTRPQVRRSVRVQAIVTTVAALVVGVPLGIGAGRASWRGFARELGVVPDSSGAWGWIAAITLGALLIALVAAVIPARFAASSTPAESLRAE